MPRDIPAFVVSLLIAGCSLASAQSVSTATTRAFGPPVVQTASAAGGRILGIVRDDLGQALAGVSVVALGTTLASVRSDALGRFVLSLAPGEYILRATRDGYVSTFREPVRVQSNTPLERNITLLRQTGDVLLASALGGDPDHAHSEAAWRLRYLTRTVLRDGAMTGAPVAAGISDDAAMSPRFRPRGTAFDTVVAQSARAATSFFSETDFRGQFNFLTSSSLTGASWRPDDWPRGIASFAVGAPVGTSGDWLIRAAVNASDQSSWVLVGEYEARDEGTHAFRTGFSYSTQGFVPVGAMPVGAASVGSRSVGSAYGLDRWRISRGLEVEYGLRVDRFDYVSVPTLVSPRLGVKIQVAPATHVVASGSHRMTAPGADEFLPPSSEGPWLPPERTFEPLFAGAAFRAERVRRYEVGVDHEFRGGRQVLSVRRFTESARNQVASIFGLDDYSRVGQYYVATSGDVDSQGWTVRLSGQLLSRLSGSVDYTHADARWPDMTMTRLLRRVAPSAARRGRASHHDTTAALEARVPGPETRVRVEYRLNTAFSGVDRTVRLPVTDGRFAIELRQKLPFQPFEHGTLEAVFAARTLLRDLADVVSIHDELLTIAPPLRLLGGVQVRF